MQRLNVVSDIFLAFPLHTQTTVKRKVAEHYDKLSKSYDRFDNILGGLYNPRLYTEMINYFESGNAALDIACGTGNMSFKLAKRFEKVYGLDISKGMLKRAKKLKIKRAKNMQIYFIYGDGEHLPFKDESFDAVTCMLAIEHFSNTEMAVSEMKRVLKGGGILVINLLEKAPPTSIKDRIWWAIFKIIWKWLDPKWKEISTDIDSEKLGRFLDDAKKYEERNLFGHFFRCHFNNVVFIYQKDRDVFINDQLKEIAKENNKI